MGQFLTGIGIILLMDGAEQNQPYGKAENVVPHRPDAPEVEPGYVPSSLIWAYASIVSAFLCSPIGALIGVWALTRKPQTPRARMLAITAIVFGSFWTLVIIAYTVVEVGAELRKH
ncbi:MAG: hypothetical protein KDB90_04730 [Planctomycetes bacterium]|nr:hypothetical protein [Planctomycetota bacterium]